MIEFRAVARWLVFAVFCASLVVSLASWLVRTRRVSPFSALARGLRSLSDPFLRPIETRVVRAGGNPSRAGWWLVIGVAVVGVVLLSLLDWVSAITTQVAGAAEGGGGSRAFLRLGVVVVYNVFFIALLVRVLGSWFGAFRYSRWMRPAYALTDWLVEPLRRMLPPMGMFDLSPLAAWFVLWVIRLLLLSVI
jgi:YggT family protein